MTNAQALIIASFMVQIYMSIGLESPTARLK
jgi:hypothetical protein